MVRRLPNPAAGRKERVKANDVFVSKSFKVFLWVQEHLKILLVLGLVGGLGACLLWFGDHYFGKRNLEASALLERALQTLEQEVPEEPKPEPSAPQAEGQQTAHAHAQAATTTSSAVTHAPAHPPVAADLAAGGSSSKEVAAKGSPAGQGPAAPAATSSAAADLKLDIDHPPAITSETLKWQVARAQFNAAAKKATNKGLKNLANFYVAHLTAKLGETALAKQKWQKLVQDLAGDDNLYSLAVDNLATLQLDSGEIKEAIDTLELAINSLTSKNKGKRSTQKNSLLYKQALLYLDQQNYLEAEKALSNIDKDAVVFYLAAEKLKELKALQQTESAPAPLEPLKN